MFILVAITVCSAKVSHFRMTPAPFARSLSSCRQMSAGPSCSNHSSTCIQSDQVVHVPAFADAPVRLMPALLHLTIYESHLSSSSPDSVLRGLNGPVWDGAPAIRSPK